MRRKKGLKNSVEIRSGFCREAPVITKKNRKTGRARKSLGHSCPDRGARVEHYFGAVGTMDPQRALQCAQDCDGPGRRRRFPVVDGIPVLLADDATVVAVGDED